MNIQLHMKRIRTPNQPNKIELNDKRNEDGGRERERGDTERGQKIVAIRIDRMFSRSLSLSLNSISFELQLKMNLFLFDFKSIESVSRVCVCGDATVDIDSIGSLSLFYIFFRFFILYLRQKEIDSI